MEFPLTELRLSPSNSPMHSRVDEIIPFHVLNIHLFISQILYLGSASWACRRDRQQRPETTSETRGTLCRPPVST